MKLSSFDSQHETFVLRWIEQGFEGLKTIISNRQELSGPRLNRSVTGACPSCGRKGTGPPHTQIHARSCERVHAVETAHPCIQIICLDALGLCSQHESGHLLSTERGVRGSARGRHGCAVRPVSSLGTREVVRSMRRHARAGVATGPGVA